MMGFMRNISSRIEYAQTMTVMMYNHFIVDEKNPGFLSSPAMIKKGRNCSKMKLIKRIETLNRFYG